MSEEADPYCLPDEKGYIHCPHCRAVEKERAAKIPRREIPDGAHWRDLTESEVSEIRRLAGEAFGMQAAVIEILDRVFQIIGLEGLDAACSPGEPGEFDNYLGWLYPDCETPEAYADSILEWSKDFTDEMNKQEIKSPPKQ